MPWEPHYPEAIPAPQPTTTRTFPRLRDPREFAPAPLNPENIQPQAERVPRPPISPQVPVPKDFVAYNFARKVQAQKWRARITGIIVRALPRHLTARQVMRQLAAYRDENPPRIRAVQLHIRAIRRRWRANRGHATRT